MHPLLRRSLAAAVGISITMALLPVAFGATFTDVNTSTRYRAAIEALQAKGVLEGYSDGSFKAGNSINRAEFLKIILEARGTTIAELTGCFPDVQNEWFAKYVCTAKKEGIVEGNPDGLYHPERDINFVEAGKILTLAFKQEVQGNSPDWYEPYGRALESSKAIPTTVAKLDAALTRGEMAEMMWRLDESKTDQPTKGYLNVKYPEVAINLASDTPQTAKSCVDLKAFREEASRSQGMMYYRGGGVMLQDAVGAPAPAAANESKATIPSTGGGGDGGYSQTNVQVEGVDEADIVKTDGEYLYIVRNAEKSTVRIVKATPSNGLQEVASIDISSEAEGAYAQDLYIDGNTLVVIAQRQVYHIMRAGGAVQDKMIAPGEYYPGSWYVPRVDVRLYDVSNAASPKETRTLSFDGYSVSTRRIGQKMYLVLNQPTYWGGPMPLSATEKDLLPQMEDSSTGKTTSVARCADVMILPRVPQPQYLTVAVVPTNSATAEIQTSVVLGNAENIYASLNNLYVASTEWNYNWDAVNPASTEKTNVFRFAFTGDGVEMKSQGSVPGRILNQFSMDEKDATFRIATTKSDQWRSNGETVPSTNNMYVLNMNMEQTGKIEDIAPGEQIYSVRFMGDRAYMVTFKKIDPFFVIDLKDPRDPKILGKLKIPGYSDYLHPYDENHIIGFGKDAVESKTGDFAWYQGIKMAMFDVTDVNNPKEMHTVVIGDRGTDSPLLHNHKALLFEKDRGSAGLTTGLLAFPIQISKISDEQKKQNDGSAYGTPVFQGAQVYDISLKDGFTLRGSITHVDDPSRYEKSGDYWYGAGDDVERIVRIGTSLYTISQKGVRAHGEVTVKEEGRMTFK